MMAHTQGPWEFELMLDKRYAVYGQNARHRIATISNYVEHDDFDNARLIAAAPELLEALEAFVREHDCEASAFEDDSLCECKLCIPARAAIAKARGW